MPSRSISTCHSPLQGVWSFINLTLARQGQRLGQLQNYAQPGHRELAGMNGQELNDLGIGRGEIPAVLEAPLHWRRDRR